MKARMSGANMDRKGCLPSTTPAAAAAHFLAAKWDRYYAADAPAPFDSTRPSSQLVNYLCSCIDDRVCHSTHFPDCVALADLANKAPLCLPAEAVGQQDPHNCDQCRAYKPPPGGRVLELGCGTGASSRWLAQQGYNVTAVDISAPALQAAAAASAAEGLPEGNPVWLLRDVFELTSGCQQLPTTQAGALGAGGLFGLKPKAAAGYQGCFDFIYDCQVYHVLVRDQPEHSARLPCLLYDLLRPRGLLMILAGNANEPEVGPNVLSAEELLQPLLSAGFELVLLRQTRFDSTNHYSNVLGMRPLAWWVLLQRP